MVISSAIFSFDFYLMVPVHSTRWELMFVRVFVAPPALTIWKATLVKQSSRLLVVCLSQLLKSHFWVSFNPSLYGI